MQRRAGSVARRAESPVLVSKGLGLMPCTITSPNKQSVLSTLNILCRVSSLLKLKPKTLNFKFYYRNVKMLRVST